MYRYMISYKEARDSFFFYKFLKCRILSKIAMKKFKFTLEIFWLSWFNIREFYFKLIVWKVIFESHTIFPKKRLNNNKIGGDKKVQKRKKKWEKIRKL